MIKRIFISMMMLSALSSINAQQDAKAKEILDKVSAKTKTFTTIKAVFDFKLENKQDNTKNSYEGTIFIKGNKYMAKLLNNNSYFDGKTLYNYNLDAGEVNVSEPDQTDENTLNPATIFNMYEKGFKYQYIGEKTESGKIYYEIDLFPEKRDKKFSKIKLLVEKTSLQIYSIHQIGKDGNNVTVIVKKMETNLPMDDKMFVFDTAANPKVDVIDMR